jgi:Cu/Ag efflux pump CusA
MLASLVVALTLVPALGAKVQFRKTKDSIISNLINTLKVIYNSFAGKFLALPTLTIGIFTLVFIAAIYQIDNTKRIELPRVDEGKVTLSITCYLSRKK